MDLNIGAALWMAAKAEGQVKVVSPRTKSNKASYRHGGATDSGADAATVLLQEALPGAAQPSGAGEAVALPGAAPQAHDTSQNSTPHHKLMQEPSRCAAEVAGHHSNLHGPSSLVHEAHTSRQPPDQAACTASTSSAMPHTATPCSQAASPDMGEPYQNGNSVKQAGNAQDSFSKQAWYKSVARVVLLGHGADEQHAGYGRHRTSFRNQVSSDKTGYVRIPLQ